MRIEEDADHTCIEASGLGRAVKLPINIFNSITLIVLRGDDFTTVTETQPFRNLFFETNEIMNYLAISRNGSEPT